jgi:hypothetical protein
MFEHPANSVAAVLQDLQQPAEKDPWRDLLDDPDLTPSWDMGPPSDPPDISGKSAEDSIELMVKWFRDNFEDPAGRTPCDEGEYVYVWGGPCDAREELEDAFSHVASQELIEAATAEIETDGYEWAPAGRRMRPEAPRSELVAAKQKLMAAFESSDDGAATARFDKHAVALVLHELYRLERRLDSVRLALDRNEGP